MTIQESNYLKNSQNYLTGSCTPSNGAPCTVAAANIATNLANWIPVLESNQATVVTSTIKVASVPSLTSLAGPNSNTGSGANGIFLIDGAGNNICVKQLVPYMPVGDYTLTNYNFVSENAGGAQASETGYVTIVSDGETIYDRPLTFNAATPTLIAPKTFSITKSYIDAYITVCRDTPLAGGTYGFYMTGYILERAGDFCDPPTTSTQPITGGG